jgi:hypothetical protein
MITKSDILSHYLTESEMHLVRLAMINRMGFLEKLSNGPLPENEIRYVENEKARVFQFEEKYLH